MNAPDSPPPPDRDAVSPETMARAMDETARKMRRDLWLGIAARIHPDLVLVKVPA